MKNRLFFCVFLFSIQNFANAQNQPSDRVKEQKSTTNMDFDSTMIDGKMKAPAGFLLQGRNRQSLSNMVKLRSNFSTELKDSEAAVKALVK